MQDGNNSKPNKPGKKSRRARRSLRCVWLDPFKCPICGSSLGFRVVKSRCDKDGNRRRIVVCRDCRNRFNLCIRHGSTAF